MTEINKLVVESINEDGYITEKTFQAKTVRRSINYARGQAVGGKIRSLSKGSNLNQRISRLRAQLNTLMDQQRRQYGGRARSAAMKG